MVDELTGDDLGQVLIVGVPKDVQDAVGDKALRTFENKDKASVLEDAATPTAPAPS